VSKLYYSLKAYNTTLTVASSLVITDSLLNCLHYVGHAVAWGTPASTATSYFRAEYVQLVSARSDVASLPSSLTIGETAVALPATLGSEVSLTGSIVDIVYIVLDKQVNPYYWANSSRNLNTDPLDFTLFEVDDTKATKKEVVVNNLSFGVGLTLPLEDSWPYLQCVYWDEATLDWSSSGCNTTSSSPSQVKCACDHLTMFSVLSVAAPARPSGPGGQPLVPGRLVDREISNFPVCTCKIFCTNESGSMVACVPRCSIYIDIDSIIVSSSS
jgi:hypothetical protein